MSSPAPLPRCSTDNNNLADRLARSRLPESDVRHYPQAILEELIHMHRKGFVHYDIKPSNLLLTSSDEMKIADFKLIGKVREAAMPSGCGGHLLVEEMATGKSMWSCDKNSDANVLLYQIGFGEELPEIPLELSKTRKDFLENYFVRDLEK
ncbi:Phosphoenolpyruvate carboxylase kinase 4 [Asimina triloba]